VKQFRPGDEVFGDVGDHGLGAFAQYVCVPENALALKPSNMSYEEAAAAPLAATVALQGLRDSGQIRPRQRTLVIGASGGIGTFAVQIAKSFGAEVTGVCSTRKLDLVRSIGADEVIDYTREDFALNERHYDLIFDIVANRPVLDYLRALRPKGIYVACAFSAVALFAGPVISAISRKKVTSLIHKTSAEDLIFVKELLEAGKVVPVIDRCYPLSEVAEALRYYWEGHPQGKVVIAVEHSGK
jgi:NADPH:quinone reductase-like Zn-dependent oxidoreductase